MNFDFEFDQEDWDSFYSHFRQNREASPELMEFINDLKSKVPPNEIDNSDNICVVLPEKEWADLMDFLISIGAPTPNNVQMSPMHADPMEMDNHLQSFV